MDNTLLRALELAIKEIDILTQKVSDADAKHLVNLDFQEILERDITQKEANIEKLKEHITLLKERLIEDESSYVDATKAAFKRYIDAEGIRPNERFSKVVKQLEMYLPQEDEEGYEYDEERGCEDCHTIPQPGGCACGRYEK
jgi:hypothetical protein